MSNDKHLPYMYLYNKEEVFNKTQTDDSRSKYTKILVSGQAQQV